MSDMAMFYMFLSATAVCGAAVRMWGDWLDHKERMRGNKHPSSGN